MTGVLVTLNYEAATIAEQMPLGDYDRLLFESKTEAEEFAKLLAELRQQDSDDHECLGE